MSENELQKVLNDIALIVSEGKIGDKVAREMVRRIVNSTLNKNKGE